MGAVSLPREARSTWPRPSGTGHQARPFRVQATGASYNRRAMTSSTAPQAPSTPASTPAPPSRGYYKEHLGDLASRLRDAVPREQLKRLHRRSGLRHFLVLLRHAALGGACLWGTLRFEEPLIWVPLAALQGTVILGFIILLHDVIHGAVFAHRRPLLTRILGLAYAAPSAIAASQFERWHLDHHKELGSADADPKRAHLSPKRNARWLKLLYVTPALFLIYARAAGMEFVRYPADLRRRIRLERFGNLVLHAAFVAAVWSLADGGAVVRAWLVPLFGFFPAAFMVNRLGQHYWVDPSDPAKWGTRVDGSPITRFLQLNSNCHLEHHYFPSVPLYSLPELNRTLRPFWDGIGHPSRSYPALLWGWFVRNRQAHTDWEADPR